MKKSISCTFLVLVFLCSCSRGSNIEGKVEDSISGAPLSDVMVIAATKTNIKEDKKLERITSKTDANGSFKLKGLSSKYRYSISTSRSGYSEAKTYVSPPEQGLTKILETPLKIFQRPPSTGIFVKKDGKFQKMESVPVEYVKFFSRSTSQTMSVYYVPQKTIENTKYVKVKNRNLLYFNTDSKRYYLTQLNPLSVDKASLQYFKGPNELYNYKGYFPDGIYCGLHKLDRTTRRHNSESVEVGRSPFSRINNRKGKYILTDSKFNHWTGMAYSETRYSPKAGWLIEIE